MAANVRTSSMTTLMRRLTTALTLRLVTLTSLVRVLRTTRLVTMAIS